ncbi:hypothetical protein BDK88_3704 [Natrinema hispanicum]|uniref:Uncharacterized protein n=1 Tax=Natrinema hispanicum TaxID=392421 RepID=A0A482Y9W9_9EURY|nr:hypothetical protein [Natrinema hispanicum]RZV06677.1 hypothetical protein BDK88_3704 [Natrinema hispanicum]
MNLRGLPVVGDLLEAGAEDRVFDVLLLVGPLLILFIAVVGRSVLTSGGAIIYILFFILYIIYRGTHQ